MYSACNPRLQVSLIARGDDGPGGQLSCSNNVLSLATALGPVSTYRPGTPANLDSVIDSRPMVPSLRRDDAFRSYHTRRKPARPMLQIEFIILVVPRKPHNVAAD